ncbi:MAG: thioredoxin domain-containing protein [Caldilineaceae bacterium]|nr:thioredoxin domain-containing protein [Caldilineaceae bacterium]
MRKFPKMQRQWWWVIAVALVLVLASCVTQIPAAAPESPVVDTPADAPAAEADATTEAGSEVAATDEASSEEAASDEAPVAAVDGAELIGGAALGGDETYKGLPVGFTEEGFPYRGDPDAPIVMVEYSDFGCPFCKRHFVQTEPAVDEAYVRSGEVRVVFHDFPLVSLHPNAPAAHEASLCVAAQGSATQYWNMHAELFRSVEEWQALPDPLPVFARLAAETGVDTAVYEACMASGEYKSVVQERVDAGFARGFQGTPSFQFVREADNAVFELVGAQPYEQFAGVVDSALAGEMPAAPAAEAQPQEQGIPFWATAEGWQPDPDRPGYNMAGDQYRGDINAPVTVIEFSDFQCPFCLRHVTETQPVLDEKYVDSGKVLWVYKHFPLNIHPQAPAAGVAAECAGDQGKFWEMHEALFASVDAWSISDPTPVFESLASEVGLDADAFAACLADPAIAARVESDAAEGAQFVQGTPTFIIVRGAQGSIIPGALPEASFSEVLDEELAAAGVTE